MIESHVNSKWQNHTWIQNGGGVRTHEEFLLFIITTTIVSQRSDDFYKSSYMYPSKTKNEGIPLKILSSFSKPKIASRFFIAIYRFKIVFKMMDRLNHDMSSLPTPPDFLHSVMKTRQEQDEPKKNRDVANDGDQHGGVKINFRFPFWDTVVSEHREMQQGTHESEVTDAGLHEIPLAPAHAVEHSRQWRHTQDAQRGESQDAEAEEGFALRVHLLVLDQSEVADLRRTRLVQTAPVFGRPVQRRHTAVHCGQHQRNKAELFPRFHPQVEPAREATVLGAVRQLKQGRDAPREVDHVQDAYSAKGIQDT